MDGQKKMSSVRLTFRKDATAVSGLNGEHWASTQLLYSAPLSETDVPFLEMSEVQLCFFNRPRFFSTMRIKEGRKNAGKCLIFIAISFFLLLLFIALGRG